MRTGDIQSVLMTARDSVDAETLPVAQVRESGCPARSWYCARTKPKSEHIAAANLERHLGLEVFHPRLQVEQKTRRGVVRRITEPLFPGYVFVRCVLEQSVEQIRHTTGVSSIVNFGRKIPAVPEAVIAELQECFGAESMLAVDKHPAVGDGVTLRVGVFYGLEAVVVQSWPARRRVQILLDILGRPTPLEVDSSLVQLENRTLAGFLPALAAPAGVYAGAA